MPIGGTLSDQISDILQNLLVPFNVTARADYVRESKEPGGPIDAINFRVTGVTMSVADIAFQGAGAEELPDLQAASEKLIGKDYSRSAVLLFAQTYLLPVYQARGFLNATISDPQPKVAGETADETQIAVQLTVVPGASTKSPTSSGKATRSSPPTSCRLWSTPSRVISPTLPSSRPTSRPSTSSTARADT